MPIVSFVSFESIRGKKCHEGIFISKDLNLNQVSFNSNEPAASLPGSIGWAHNSLNRIHNTRATNLPNISDREAQSFGINTGMTVGKGTIEGTYIELHIRRNRSSSRLKIQHFFKLNDPNSQKMICLRQVGITVSLPVFFTFLQTIPLPALDETLSSEIGQTSNLDYPDMPASTTSPFNCIISGTASYVKTPEEVAREWYISVIQKAENQRLFWKTY